MEASLALTIIGTTLILVGLIFNAIPVLVNKQIMGDLAEEAVNPAAALRTILGGSAIAVGFIAFYCRGLPNEQASTLLTALGVGMIVIMSTIILIKPRGFADDIPIPPVVMFIILTIIAFYLSLIHI